MTKKKAPMRKCIGCGQQKMKKDLVRVVKNKEEEIFVDTSGRANGRGAYICNSKECLKKAVNNNELQRSLKSNIDEVVLNELEKIID